MKLKSYAKINIGLKIFKDKKGENKHEIDSIFYLINNLYDVIKIEPSDCLSIQYISNNKEINIEDCLVKKSMLYLQSKYKININYDILITKNIPFSSGLGGASSNAACVINYILSKNPPIFLDLKDIALNLGSDIPFFLTQYTIARVKRYGEYVTPLTTDIQPKINLLLTHVQCLTKQVFDLLEKDNEYESKVDIDKIFLMLLNKQHNNVVYNDLTKYIIKSNNKLQEIVDANPDTFFTGSGGTLVRIEDNKYEN